MIKRHAGTVLETVRSHKLGLLYLYAGLYATAPLLCLIAYITAPGLPRGTLLLTMTPLPVIAVLTMNGKRRTRVLFAALAALASACAAWRSPIPYKVSAAAAAFLWLLIPGRPGADRARLASVLCLLSCFAGLVIGALIQLSAAFAQRVNHTIHAFPLYLSFVSAIVCLAVRHLDDIRSFGEKRIRIPRATARFAAAALLTAAILTAVISLSDIWVNAFVALFHAVGSAIGFFSRFLASLISPAADTGMPLGQGGLDLLPLMPEAETAGADFPEWVAIALVSITAAGGAGYLGYKLSRLIHRLILYIKRVLSRPNTADEIAYTEEIVTVEADPIGTKAARGRRLFSREPAYASLTSEAERVRYIYREYIKYAKRAGQTSDDAAASPREVLSEIAANTGDDSYHIPDELAGVYHIARYAGEGTPLNGADVLRQKVQRQIAVKRRRSAG